MAEQITIGMPAKRTWRYYWRLRIGWFLFKLARRILKMRIEIETE